MFWGGLWQGLSQGCWGLGAVWVVVPFLVWVLPYASIPHGLVMHVAVGTSLVLVVCTSVSSSINHQRQKAIWWPLFWSLLPGIAIGAIIASFLSPYISGNYLGLAFALFAILMALHLGLRKVAIEDQRQQPVWPGNIVQTLIAAVIAGICNLLGMGGGSLLVPYFRRQHMPMPNAVATSALCGVPISSIGVLMMLLMGHIHDAPPWTAGYIYWPAFLVMVIPSMLSTSVGARMAHRLPAKKLQKIFAGFLLLIGIDMIVDVFIT